MRNTILAALALLIIISVSSCGGETPKSTSDAVSPIGKSLPAEAATEPQPAPDRQVQAVGPVPPLLTQALTDSDEITLYWDSILPGDYNVDGIVNGMDVFPLAVHFGEDVAGSPGNECIDGNGDTTLNGLDLFTIAVGFEDRVDGVFCYVEDNPGGDFDGTPINETYIAYGGCWAQQEYAWTIPGNGPTYFAVRSYDADAAEFSEASEVVYPDDPPAIVNGLTATPGAGSIVLDWNDSPEVDFATYRVGRSDTSGGPYVDLPLGELTVSAFVDFEPEAGQTWYYVVCATDIYDASSDFCEEVAGTPGALPVCEGLTWRGGTGENDFDLGWEPDTSGFWKGWVIEMRNPPGDWQQWYPNVNNNEGDPDYGLVISKLYSTNGWLRDYRVAARALDDSMGPWTELLQVGPSDVPDPPVELDVSNQDSVVWLYITPSTSEDRIGYNIYTSEVSGGPYERWGTSTPFEKIPPTSSNTGSTRFSQGFGGLTNETSYYFVVTTVDDMRTESAYSMEIEAHPSAPPPVPTDVLVEGWHYAPWARVTWSGDMPADWACWRVWRSVDAEGPWQHLGETTENEFIDDTLNWSDEYYYFVSSEDIWGVQSDKTVGEFFAPGPDRWMFTTVGADDDVSQYHAITWEGNDYPAVAYYETRDASLDVAQYNGSSWQVTEGIDSMLDPSHPSIAWGSSTGLGVAYRRGGEFPRLKYAWNYGSGWFVDSIITGSDYGYRSSIAFYNGTYPAVAFIDSDNSDLLYAIWNLSSWDIDIVYDAYSEGLGLDFDSLDRPTIGFYRSYLHASKKVAGNWITSQISDAVQPWYVDADLDSNDYGIFSYHNPDTQRMEAYWKQGENWNSHVIDERTSTGWYGSVAFDGNGRPAVAYRGAAPSGNWTFAWWDGDAWRRIERPGDTTTWTDIAFNSDGEPAVSYYASDYSELRVAVCNVPE